MKTQRAAHFIKPLFYVAPKQEKKNKQVLDDCVLMPNTFHDLITLCLPDRTRAMPPVRTLLFLVPLVKALRPSTTPAKQLSTASSMKARVASQKAGNQKVQYVHVCADCAPHASSLRIT